MAKVTAQVLGGALKQIEADTISGVKALMGEAYANYQATVNGEAADDDYELADYEFVALSAKVKGA